MPALPLPPFLKMLTLGATVGGFATGPDDYLVEDIGLNLRGGTLVPDTPVELELSLLWTSGTTRTHGFAEATSLAQFEMLGTVLDRERLDLFVGGGVGWRHVRLEPSAGVAADPADALAFRGNPTFDAMLSAGGGARVMIWGPVHVRADARAVLWIGESPTTQPTHAWPGAVASIGIDLRYEPPPDRDGDGVADKKDQCPESMEDFDYYEDADGCLDPDDDGDKIADVNDRCKSQAEDLDGYRDEDGCEDSNNDSDAFPDVSDRCPDQPETENSWEDGDGCPDALPTMLAGILGKQPAIGFDADDKLVPSSEARLQEIASVLKEYPDTIVHINVATDSVGGGASALARTLAQCLALHGWLVAHGIPDTRLAMHSFGVSAAIGTEQTEAERAANRWVEVSLFDNAGSDGKAIPFTPRPPREW
ncbi:MAG: hypothetical protein EXR71_09775 [Myxococcales bacterium]|nr:hypothetical protein [Myxococcales bacterium]